MKILAFETSCDDTAVALVEDGVRVLAGVRISQIEHEKWGGVVPEIAARLHAENWKGALEECLVQAGVGIEEVDYLAVTSGPGLQTSLLTGTTAASFLALLYGKKIIPVHHILGHISSVFLDRERENVAFPSLVLTVSGGHTEMHLAQEPTKLQKLGKTLDDAAGEAFDKCAKMLGLGYPGGPIVSQWAEKGDRQKYKFPRIYLGKDSLDFSFSGLKAAVYREVEKEQPPKSAFSAGFNKTFIADVCASFEFTVARIFLKKIERALERFPEVKNVVFVGGVSANTYLKKELMEFLQARGISFLTPQKQEYSTDNAAMIGAAAYFLLQENPKTAQKIFVEADPRLDLEGFLEDSIPFLSD